MSTSTFLDMQYYNLSKRKLLWRMFSSRSGQNSGSLSVFHPNMDKMKQIFDKFDRDIDGKISQAEYNAILKALQKESTTKDVQMILEVADLVGDGFIDFEKLVEVQKKCGGLKTMDVQRAFGVFDVNGDGKISVEEVFELLERLGERCSVQDCQKMIRAIDTNEDGVNDMDDFLTMMTKSSKLY